MTIEIALLISFVSVGFGVYSGVANLKRNMKRDTQDESAQTTTVIVKLENINSMLTEMKGDLKNIRSDVQELRDRQIKTEEELKAVIHRIESLEQKEKQ